MLAPARELPAPARKRILQLPTAVVTQIAAGEVIERPASVVKEFLENSVDAGSTRIDVEIEQGGSELIRVVDNGCGILAEDFPLAFACHATSKLASAADLFQIGTLGFRGEALASIAGVGQVTLQSRPAGLDCGAEVTCHGGELSPVRPWNGSPGTRIEVRHLFFNTPVRRKFLRTTATEMGHICEVFTRLALAQPGLHLTLRHNGKQVHAVPAGDDLRNRLGLFFGSDIRDQLYRVEGRAGPIRLTGYIADPASQRGNAKMQYLFVNGRWIRDRSLGHALQEGYRGLLMTGRYAIAFLFLELPADQVDVNIHPTKSEVRFRDSSALYHLVLTSVRERLRRQNLTPRLRIPGAVPASADGDDVLQTPEAASPSWTLTPGATPAPALPFSREPRPSPSSTPFPELRDRWARAPALPAIQARPPEYRPSPASPAASEEDQSEEEETAPPVAAAENDETPLAAAGLAARPPVIQLYDAYLVLETPEGMLVIDQHALHERIQFEHLKSRLRTGSLETQRLLIPEPIDLPAEQAARVLEQREALAELGLGVEDFGGGTILLTSYPVLLSRRPPPAIFRAVLDHLVSQERVPSREQFLNNVLSTMACHSAVRAGDRLTEEEIHGLLAQRHLADNTHHCPHGRPTTLLLSKADLDRQFGRT